MKIFSKVALMTGVAAVAFAATAEARTLRLNHNNPPDHPLHISMEFMGDRLSELTDGAWDIQVFPNGQLGNQRESMELVQSCVLDMAKSNASELEAFEPTYSALNLPYLFLSEDHQFDVLTGEIGQEILDASHDKGFQGIAFLIEGARSFYGNKPINTPADLQGMKIRVQPSPSAIRMVELLGGSPTPHHFALSEEAKHWRAKSLMRVELNGLPKDANTPRLHKDLTSLAYDAGVKCERSMVKVKYDALSGLPTGKAVAEFRCVPDKDTVMSTIRSGIIAKVVGVTCVVATGLPLGREGPMVHTGAIVAARVTQDGGKNTGPLRFDGVSDTVTGEVYGPLGSIDVTISGQQRFPANVEAEIYNQTMPFLHHSLLPEHSGVYAIPFSFFPEDSSVPDSHANVSKLDSLVVTLKRPNYPAGQNPTTEAHVFALSYNLLVQQRGMKAKFFV